MEWKKRRYLLHFISLSIEFGPLLQPHCGHPRPGPCHCGYPPGRPFNAASVEQEPHASRPGGFQPPPHNLFDLLFRDSSEEVVQAKRPRAAGGPAWLTLCPRCLATQGAATRPTALAPGPQHPGRPHGWRNGWRNGSQVTTPPGLPAASPTELGGGALPAALPDGCVWLADGSSGSWRSPTGVKHAATRRATHSGHLRRSPPRRC